MRVAVLLATLLVAAVSNAVAADLNYDELVILDAEALAETGLKAAYEELLPHLTKYFASAAAVTERIDNDAPYRFFAINGGNDLGGMFLTPAQAEAAKQSLPRKQDWPYLPTASKPWYGRYH
jgi:hypothetical protein